MNGTCKTCVYYSPKTYVDNFTNKALHESHGFCRIRAPVKTFPIVHNNDWCGERRVDFDKVNEDK